MMRVRGMRTDRDVVVIVDGDQSAKLQVPCSTGGLGSNAFHRTPVAEEHVCVIIYEIIARLVERCSSMLLSEGEANCVAKALAERSGGHLNAIRIVRLGVARCDAVHRLLTCQMASKICL